MKLRLLDGLLNPALLFSLVWLFVLLLYQLQYAGVLLPLTPTAVFLVLASCISFFLPSAFFWLDRPSLGTRAHAGTRVRYRGLKAYVLIWIFLSLIEVGIAGNIPLLGVLGVGEFVRYTDFGIPSVHGFLNAILLVLTNYALHLYLTSRARKYLIYFFLCLGWPVLAIHRQTLISQVIQSLLIYLFHRRHIHLTVLLGKRASLSKGNVSFSRQTTRLICALLLLSISVYVFGLLGDVRKPEITNIRAVAQAAEHYPDFLPSGLLWAYVYVTSPFSNVIENLEDLRPNYLPLASGVELIPSFGRDYLLGLLGKQYDWQLTVEYLNVSSFHRPFLSDFGIHGALLVYALLSTCALVVYRKAMTSRLVCWRFVTVVFLHNIILSVFTNFFTHLVFLAQILIHLSLQIRVRLGR